MRRPRLGASGIVVAVAVAGLAAVIAFLAAEGRANADQWSSSFSFVLAYVCLAATVVGWVANRAESPASAAEVADSLRTTVRRQWCDEAQARDLQSPRPLRLRWHPTRRPVVAATRSARSRDAPSGELLQDDDDARPAAVALAETITARHSRQFVILGRKGGGKTTLAMLYVLAATESASPGHPVPVMLSVAGWDPDNPIEDWVESRIVEDYPAFGATRTRPTLRALIRDGGVTAVLDGLDEIPAALLPEALRKLDRAAGAGMRSLVTCRIGEFQAAVDEAGVLSHAEVVEIEPITVEDAAYFLTQREVAESQRWAPVLAEMRDRPGSAVATSLDTPLMVSLARQVFESPGSRPVELTDLGSAAEIQRRLLDRFLPSVYGGKRPAARAARHLSFLSHHLREVVRDPNLRWWELSRAVPSAVLTAGIVLVSTTTFFLLGVILAAVDRDGFSTFGERLTTWGGGGAAIGGVLGICAGLHAGRISRARRRPGLARSVAGDLGTMVFLLCLAGAAAGTLLMIDYYTSRPAAYVLSSQIRDVFDYWFGRPRGRLEFGLSVLVLVGVVTLTNGLGFGLGGAPRRAAPRGRTVLPSLVFGLGVGSLFGLIITVVYWSAGDQSLTAWPGVVSAAGFGIPVALGRWLNAPGETGRAPSPESVLVADRAALVVSAVVVAGSVQFVALPLLVLWAPIDITMAWLITSCCAVAVFVVVLLGSGASWVSYTAARLWLALRGRLPWRLFRFLAHARDAGVLRQAGPAFQIRHDLIRDHLADQWPVRARPAERRRSSGWARRHRRVVIAGIALVMATLFPAAVAFVEAHPPVPAAVYDAGGLSGDVTALAVGSDGGALAAAGIDYGATGVSWSLMRWEPGSRRGLLRGGTTAELIRDLRIDPTGVVASADIGGYVIYDERGRRRSPFSPRIDGVDFTADKIITGDEHGELQAWPVEDDGPPVALRHVGDVTDLSVSAEADVVATASGSGVRVWNLRTGSVRILAAAPQSIPSIDLSADGATLAVVDVDGDAAVWRLGEGGYQQIRSFPGEGYGSVVSPDGGLLATRPDDGGLRLRDTATGRVVAALPRTACVVSAVAFDRSGSRLATGCGREVKVWSVPDLIASQG
ncbi:hypothetical protein QLQ12_27140 [Actinoplanes sp. NEAU-A12]|uniref:NACHT domain-containing protein n=1 Tax=Actinoplanes sandaracinus TaxID=3045177 RepID=A0ABT6WRH4_9ACTN|nr:hypothetical protein [Actinoplanes sandaracinus]MDI6102299.1 hypothetical protein [Actinoplanes sandaracinus]